MVGGGGAYIAAFSLNRWSVPVFSSLKRIRASDWFLGNGGPSSCVLIIPMLPSSTVRASNWYLILICVRQFLHGEPVPRWSEERRDCQRLQLSHPKTRSATFVLGPVLERVKSQTILKTQVWSPVPLDGIYCKIWMENGKWLIPIRKGIFHPIIDQWVSYGICLLTCVHQLTESHCSSSSFSLYYPGCKLSEFERVTALKVYNWFANRRKEMKRRANIGETQNPYISLRISIQSERMQST